MTDLNICVTGATGFLGSRLVEKLIESKNNIFVVVRKSNKLSIINKFIKEKQITPINCDLTNSESIAKHVQVLSNCDILVNVVGYMPETQKPYDNPIPSIDVNIKGVMNLLNCLKKLKKIIQISTTDVYGTNLFIPISELHPTNPETYYAVSKLSAEKYLKIYSMRNNILLTTLRVCIMYGPEEWHDRFLPNCIQSVIKNENIEIYGEGQDVRDYLYVDDAAKAIFLAIEKDCEGVFNIASGKTYSKREVAEKIIQLSGKDLKLVFTHPEHKSTNFTFDISKAKNILSFSPDTDLEEGLLKEMEWYQNEWEGGK
jgi:UDP-glucose 4-epimerase